MGQISEQGLLEAVQVDVDIGADGLEGSLLHLRSLQSDHGRTECDTYSGLLERYSGDEMVVYNEDSFEVAMIRME